jgi:transposase-like protein
MADPKDTTIAAIMEHLLEQGPGGMADVFTSLFNIAMRLERERFLGAAHYERTDGRRGYANGFKPKKLDTQAGTLTLDIPKTAAIEPPFYPASLERGRRSSRAVMLAAAEMYVKGVSTRDVEAVLAEFGLDSLSSTQVSRAAKLLDEELEAWRNRPLGTFRHLFLDARYEKQRDGGVVRDAAVLGAIGIDPDGNRSILGVSLASSGAELHWRSFLDSLVARGLRGVVAITSDDQARGGDDPVVGAQHRRPKPADARHEMGFRTVRDGSHGLVLGVAWHGRLISRTLSRADADLAESSDRLNLLVRTKK